jgi:hypothetical protein
LYIKGVKCNFAGRKFATSGKKETAVSISLIMAVFPRETMEFTPVIYSTCFLY